MRKLIKLTIALCGVFMLGAATNASAQKFGYIDVNEVLMQMPGLDSVQIKLEKFQRELLGQLEIMQVEQNKKLDDYQKNSATMSEAVKQDKEREITNLGQRMQEFRQTAEQDMTAEQEKLLGPLLDQIEAAIEKVSKANSIIAVFNIGVPSLAYYDKAAMTDLGPLVKRELKIQ